MSCGLPCVAFDCYGMKEIINHKKDGYLAKPYSTKDFLEGIEYIAVNNKKISVSAKKNIKANYNLKKINQKYVEFFQKIL